MVKNLCTENISVMETDTRSNNQVRKQIYIIHYTKIAGVKIMISASKSL